jgi:hypothetical protein
MIIHCYDDHRCLAELQPEGQVKFFSREDNPQAATNLLAGYYAYLGERLVILHKLGKNLVLRMENRCISITDETRATLIELESVNTLEIFQSSELLVKIEYARPVIRPPLQDDPTPFVDKEQFDFGLFIKNIINSKERQMVLLDVYTD